MIFNLFEQTDLQHNKTKRIKMGASRSSCLELCANRTSRHQDKDAVLESLGIGNLKQIKRDQLTEDQIAGKYRLTKAEAAMIGERLSTIGEEELSNIGADDSAYLKAQMTTLTSKCESSQKIDALTQII